MVMVAVISPYTDIQGMHEVSIHTSVSGITTFAEMSPAERVSGLSISTDGKTYGGKEACMACT